MFAKHMRETAKPNFTMKNKGRGLKPHGLYDFRAF